ncbi:MAG: TetR family transcriptional regulator, partial [Thermoleophilia bacterium]|nr:TetR family transcriptional regulator [Thermoleophilia bacterium]
EVMRPMSISQLERESGVGRNTIYYYISIGLLPPAQKASATRAVYNRTHVELLQEITRLKGEGLALKEIGDSLADRVEEAVQNGVDLVAKQAEANREAILEAAARRFATQGYEKTRIADICKDVGVNAQLIYSHFPSKKHLFIACFEVYFNWMNVKVVGPVQETPDSAARLAYRVWAGLGLQALSRDLQAMARVEALHPESDLRPLVRHVYECILSGSGEELAADRGAGETAELFDDELVSYGFLGVLENMAMRTTWDRKYTSKDIMRNLLCMFLAVRAAYQGRIDLTKDWEAISGLVDRLASKLPQPGDPPAMTGS